mgnify:CR=1 FL=1
MSKIFFEYHIETMKEKYPTFGKYQNLSYIYIVMYKILFL